MLYDKLFIGKIVLLHSNKAFWMYELSIHVLTHYNITYTRQSNEPPHIAICNILDHMHDDTHQFISHIQWRHGASQYFWYIWYT